VAVDHVLEQLLADPAVHQTSRVCSPPRSKLIALLPEPVEGPPFDHVGGDQGPGEGVDPPDVAVEDLVEALAAQFGVEVEAAGGEPAAPEDLVEGEGQLIDRVGELVGVPPVLVVAPVGVDRAEDPVGDGVGDLVVEAVAGQGGVVDLDVDPELVLSPWRTRNPCTVAQS
jgi:hypothetical protein